MYTHDDIWRAIDRLAQTFGYSASGLAKKAGLDPTTFNKSKRHSADGKPRWPSTESISKILAVTGVTMAEFFSLADDAVADRSDARRSVPLMGFAQAGRAGYFDEDGHPVGTGWDQIALPPAGYRDQETVYALEVSGDSMAPLYRPGDKIVVSPETKIRLGDRVVVKTRGGELMIKELVKNTDTKVILRSLNKDFAEIEMTPADIEWKARIIWVSQ